MAARLRVGGVAALSVSLFACAHYPLNAPLPRSDPDYGYRVSATSGDTDDSQQLLLIVNFSGGGTRAAAFAYGVLEALRDTTVRFDGRERSLVDEIDILSSVSGGSFTAAYFAVYGRRIFDEFEARFLRRNIQRELLWRALLPFNLVRLVSPYFGRSDLAAEFYDEQMFRGATLGDLLDGDGPALLINATDMTLATRFTFDQEQFDLLCSDSMSFPIARAVAASSAVPVALSPITLKNYAARGCGYQPPSWVGEEIARGYSSTRLHQEALRIAEYRTAGAEAYVHLLDGALADNLGLRSTIEKAVEAGGYARLAAGAGFKHFRRVAFLIVNAQTDSIREWTRSASAPGVLDALTSATTVTLKSLQLRDDRFLPPEPRPARRGYSRRAMPAARRAARARRLWRRRGASDRDLLCSASGSRRAHLSQGAAHVAGPVRRAGRADDRGGPDDRRGVARVPVAGARSGAVAGAG